MLSAVAAIITAHRIQNVTFKIQGTLASLRFMPTTIPAYFMPSGQTIHE